MRIHDTKRGPRTAAPDAAAPAWLAGWLAGWHAVVGPVSASVSYHFVCPVLSKHLTKPRACFSNGLNLADG